MKYGSGFVLGSEFTDTVTLAEGLVITGQSIGAALLDNGFSGVDGILGSVKSRFRDTIVIFFAVSAQPT